MNRLASLLIISAILGMTIAKIQVDSAAVVQDAANTTSAKVQSPYAFTNPAKALRVLDRLDVFEGDVPKAKLEKLFRKPIMGVTADDDYCAKHRAYIVDHPASIFEEKNIMTCTIGGSLLRRRVIPSIGKDIMPQIRLVYKSQEGLPYNISTQVNNYFFFFDFFKYRALGQQYSCLSQSSAFAPGFEYLSRKDYFSAGIVKYAETYATRPACFNYDKFFPENWSLTKKDQCIKFFEHFNSEKYQELKKERGEIVYIRKIGAMSHSGVGVFPINSTQEEYLNNLYKGGELCGKVQQNNIIQYFVHNPLLLHGHKFDFRIYMLLASTNPMIAYYHDGFLRVSLHSYQPDSKELGALLTNTALSKTIFNEAAKNGTVKGMTSAQWKEFHLWNFQKLQDYLLTNGVITDPKWLDNYLRPEFKKALIHIVRTSQKAFTMKSSVYHLFGLDFILDDKLNLWFIEANSSPSLEGFSKEMMDFVAKMLEDHYEIVYGLMKSRMKRVINYVNNMTSTNGEVSRVKNEKVLIRNIAAKRQEFKNLTKNRFEDEFAPSAGNGFHPIIDDNVEGTGRYFNLMKEECL